MNLHNRIMNIQAKSEDVSYKTGHRDARHDAAEMVSAVQAERGEAVNRLLGLVRATLPELSEDRQRELREAVRTVERTL